MYSPEESDRIRKAVSALVDNDDEVMSELEDYLRGRKGDDATGEVPARSLASGEPGKFSFPGNTFMPPGPSS